MKKKVKKTYDDEFKRNAVNLMHTSGRTVKDIAESLGV